MTQRALGISRSKAFIAGWDASITGASNPYSRKDYSRVFQMGKAAGLRSTDDDVALLKRYISASKGSGDREGDTWKDANGREVPQCA